MRFKPKDEEERIKRTKFKTKIYQSPGRGIEFKLSFEEYCNLIDEAGITVYDIGIGADDYCLGRIGDKGAYEVGNCRFITNEQNRLEQLESMKDVEYPKGHGSYESCKGENHYKNKGDIIVPWGVFKTIREAASSEGALCSASEVGKRILKGVVGYSYSGR